MPAGFPDPKKPENIYIVGPLDGPFKVGRTNSLITRISSLQTGSPVPIKLHFYQKVTDRRAMDVEWTAHMRLRDYHLWGEWFNCTLEVAMKHVEYAFKHTKTRLKNTSSLESQVVRAKRKAAGMTKRQWRERDEHAILEAIFEDRHHFGRRAAGRGMGAMLSSIEADAKRGVTEP